MTESDALLRAVLLAPEDDAPRLVLKITNRLIQTGFVGQMVSGRILAREAGVASTRPLYTTPPWQEGKAMSRVNALEAFWSQSIDQRGPVTEEQLREIRDRFAVTGRLVPVPAAPGYAVSDGGRVFSCVPCSWARELPRELRPTRTGTGYHMVRLQIDKRATAKGVHQLVAAAFLPPPAEGQDRVRHLDGDPANNAVANLAWGTQAENCADTVRHGRTLKGLKNPNAKLNDELVVAARILASQGYSMAAIGSFLGVGGETIRRAVSGEQWGHVDVA
jgi:hypothetical protein